MPLHSDQILTRLAASVHVTYNSPTNLSADNSQKLNQENVILYETHQFDVPNGCIIYINDILYIIYIIYFGHTT